MNKLLIFFFIFNYNNIFRCYFTYSINLKENNFTNKCEIFCNEKGGKCINNLTCICYYNYDTIYFKDPIKLCNYKKFNKYYSAFTELLIGFGFGHFLCDRILSGYIRLIIQLLICFLISCFLSVSIRINYELNDSSLLKKTTKISVYVVLFLFFWRFFDFIFFITNKYKDGNNIDLY